MRTQVIAIFLALAVIANAGTEAGTRGQIVDAFQCALNINNTYNTLTSIAQDPSSIMDQWLDLKTEMYEVYKSCSFNETYEWLDDPSFHIAPESLMSPQCISDFTQFGEDIANFIQNKPTDAEDYIQDFGTLLDDVNSIYEDCQPENNEESEEEWEAEMETEEKDETEDDDDPEVEKAVEMAVELIQEADLKEIELRIQGLDDNEAFQQALDDLNNDVKDDGFGDFSPSGGSGGDNSGDDGGDGGDDDDGDRDFDDGEFLDDIVGDDAADAGIDAGVDAGLDAAIEAGFDLLGLFFYGIKSLTGLTVGRI